MELADCIVTIDAMGCQKNIAKEIMEADADYVLSLKGNQGTAEEEVRAFFEDLVPPDPSLPPPPTPQRMDYLQTIDGDHGRVETRRYWISDHIGWFADKEKWEGLRCIAMVESIREIDRTPSYERRCFLASIQRDAQRFAHACRGDWGIDPSLHWVMDVTFGEDNSRARSGNAAENLAALRRLALNMLRSENSQSKLSIRSKRLMAGWNSDYLQKILGI